MAGDPPLIEVERDDLDFSSVGVRCAAWLYRPVDRSVDRSALMPLVVLGPGLAGVRRTRLDVFAERLAAAGFAAFVFDHRGFGDSDGEPRQVVRIRGQLADWHAAVVAARAVPGVDGDRVAVWGVSIAGGHALRVAAADPSIAAVVSVVPLTSGLASALAVRPIPRQQLRLVGAALGDSWRALRRRPPRYLPVVGHRGQLAVLTSPDADADYRAIAPPGWDDRVAARLALALLAYEPGRAAGRVRCPVLLALGDDDVITPPAAAARQVSAARHLEIRRYPVRHFQAFLGPVSDAIVTDAIEFLHRHLKG